LARLPPEKRSDERVSPDDLIREILSDLGASSGPAKRIERERLRACAALLVDGWYTQGNPDRGAVQRRLHEDDTRALIRRLLGLGMFDLALELAVAASHPESGVPRNARLFGTIWTFHFGEEPNSPTANQIGLLHDALSYQLRLRPHARGTFSDWEIALIRQAIEASSQRQDLA
jgi:hypothetical protein